MTSIYAIPDPVHSYTNDPYVPGGPCRICGLLPANHGTAAVPSRQSTVIAVERLARSYAVQVVMDIRKAQLTTGGSSTSFEDAQTGGTLLAASEALMDDIAADWPFDPSALALTPNDRIAEVARAAAYAVAELERLLRAAAYPA